MNETIDHLTPAQPEQAEYRRRATMGALFAIGVVLVMVLGGVAVASPTSSTHLSVRPLGTVPFSGAPALVASSGPAPGAIPQAPPPTQFTGTFFATAGNALPSASTRPCAIPLTLGVCTEGAGFGTNPIPVTPSINASNDPALNLTSKGLLVLASTVYTTSALCPAAARWTDTQIAIQTSSNGGTTWGAATYVGTPDCGSAAKYPSSWQPAITSLGNGTLVLAYIQYNATAPGFAPYFIGTPLSRLVVSESYTSGTTWTQPTVINVSNPDPSLTVSFPPVRPSITAFGNTIYLAWMNLGSGVAPLVVSHVAMVVSSTAGKAWSPTILLGNPSAYSANPDLLVDPLTGELFITYDQTIYLCGVNGYVCPTPTPPIPALAIGTPYATDVAFAASIANGTGLVYSTVAHGVPVNQTFGPFLNPSPVLAWGSKWKVLDLAFVGGITALNGASHGDTDAGLYFYSSANVGTSWTQSTTVSTGIVNPNGIWAGLSNSTQILSIGVTPGFSSNVHLEATEYNASACSGSTCGVDMTLALNSSNNGTSWSNAYVLSGNVMGNGTNGSWQVFLTGEYESAISFGSTLLYAWTNASCPSWTTPASSTFGIGECGIFSNLTRAWNLLGSTQVQISTPYSGAGVSVTFHPTVVPANGLYDLFVLGNEYTANGATDTTVTNVPVGVPILYNYSGPGYYNASTEYLGGGPSASPVWYTTPTTETMTFSSLIPLTLEVAPSWITGRDCSVSYTGYGCPLYYSPYTSAKIGVVGDPGPNLPNPNSEACNTLGAGPDGGPDACMGDLEPYDCEIYEICYNPVTGAEMGGDSPTGSSVLTCSAFLYPYNYYDGPGDYGAEYDYAACVNAFISHNTASASTLIPYDTTHWIPVGVTYDLNVSFWSPLSDLCGPHILPPGVLAAAGTGNEWWNEWFCYGWDYNQLVPVAWFGSGPGSVTEQVPNNTGPYAGNIAVTPLGNAGINETIDWVVNAECKNIDVYWYEYGVGSTVHGPYSYNSTPCTNPSSGSSGGGLGVPLGVTETGLPSNVEWGLTLTSNGQTVSANSTTTTLTTPALTVGETYSVSVNTVPDPITGLYWVGTTVADVTSPDFAGITVTFAQRSLTGLEFTAQISENGLPDGLAWSLYVTNSTTNQTFDFPVGSTAASSVTTLELAGGTSYGFNGTDVFLANGTAYYVATVNATFDATNASVGVATPPWEGSTEIISSGQIILNYDPMYWLTVEATAGGSASPNSQWVPTGSSVALSATASTGYVFTNWLGTGNGSTGSGGYAHPQVTVKIGNPVTELANFRPIPQPTWLLNITPAGLPVSQNYSFTVDDHTYSGIGTFEIKNITTGDHTFSAPMTYSAPTVNTRYVPTSITSSSGNVTGAQYVQSDESFTVAYSTEFLLSYTITGGGTVTGVSNGAWLSPGATETLTAAPLDHYRFVEWNGTVSGTGLSISLTVNGPVREIAEFVAITAPPSKSYDLVASEQGLPTGVAWNATVGTNSSSGSSSSLSIGELNGSYTLTVPIVYGSAGVRYVPSNGGVFPLNVSANTTQSVSFTTQYLVTVVVSGAGTATPGTGWVDAGASVTVAAASNATWKFSAWNSTSVNSGSSSVTLTVNGPVTLTATFVPAYKQVSVTQQDQGLPIALGLLVVLLIVGLVMAYLMTRSRRGSASSGAGDRSEAESGGAIATYEAPMMEEAAPAELAAEPEPEPMAEEEPTEALPEYDESGVEGSASGNFEEEPQ